MNRQNLEKIGWTDWTWNFVTGCLNGCPYCYARKIAMRFYGHFKPTFHENRLTEPLKQAKSGDKIFVVSMGDLFGDWVPDEWIEEGIKIVRQRPDVIFQFLTKNPRRYQRFIFPLNCVLGTTVTTNAELERITDLSWGNSDSKKFVSFEPILGGIIDFKRIVDWVILGEATNYPTDKFMVLQTADNIITHCREYKIPVFVKGKLFEKFPLREFPIMPPQYPQEALRCP